MAFPVSEKADASGNIFLMMHPPYLFVAPDGGARLSNQPMGRNHMMPRSRRRHCQAQAERMVSAIGVAAFQPSTSLA